ncbi:MAG: hypothetical protein NZ900_01515 [Synergistetes bacterium]|nr:hypothetical protein [Synergistota bacterium]MDW8191605.1 hypothetical protein [Synergistota bacterium]
MSKIKILFLSFTIVLLSFLIFTLLRFPYERLLDKALKGLEKGGVKISYSEANVEPFKLKATFNDANIVTNLFNLRAKSLEGRLSVGELIFDFKVSVNLKLSSGDITLPAIPGIQIPFNEGRAVLERGKNSLKIGELYIRGSEILITGEIDGKKYNLRIKPSGGVEKSLAPFLRLLQKDKEGFYNLRSEI